MINEAQLKARTLKDLAAMAKKKKVPQWHAMRKDQLVKALTRHAKAEASRPAQSTNGAARKPPSAKPTNGKSSAVEKARNTRIHRRIEEVKAKHAEGKDLSFRSVSITNGHTRDRLVVMVRDPYWLHAYWELSRRSIERAQVAMGVNWHGARPALRILEVARNGVSSAGRKLVRDIEIHGGVNNWYVDVQNPPKSYQLEIGYLTISGKFYCLARSNVVSTPSAGDGEAFDKNWAEVAKDFDRIYAMSGGYQEQETAQELREVLEEQLHRPLTTNPMETQFGFGAASLGGKSRPFNFEVDTELIVHGITHPDAHVTLRGEPVSIRPDGTFAVRFKLPDRRHVLPVVASSRDGVEQRTIVLSVDRNTKVMEPILRDQAD